MNLSKIPLLGMVTKQMDWLNQRQKIISQNIANADTPDYVPHDLVSLNFADLASSQSKKLKMAVSSEKHISDSDEKNGKFRDKKNKNFTSEPSGNAVILEEQMMLQSQTQVDYELMTRLYKKHVGMVKTAIGRRN